MDWEGIRKGDKGICFNSVVIAFKYWYDEIKGFYSNL